VFEQAWPKGADSTNITEKQGAGVVSSCFPSIDPQPSGGQNLGYVWWGGRAFLEGSAGGQWQGGNTRDGPGMGTGDGGGPFVVFGENMTDSLVFAPASNFMTLTPGMSAAPGMAGAADAAHGGEVQGGGPDAPFNAEAANAVLAAVAAGAQAPPPKSDGSFCFGLDAPVASVPPGYSLQTMVYLGTGVNRAMKDWGTTMLGMYKTERPTDYASQYLGYSTDNGAYYYYGWNQPPFQKYQDALEGVYDYAAKEGIPYKHLLLDSYWYTHGNADGVKDWEATAATFPDGFVAFANRTEGWKFQMHNRHWSDDNVYAKENGGGYDFLLDPQSSPKDDKHSGMALPLEQELWDDLMSNKTAGGIPLSVYEQDWLYNEWQGIGDLRASPTLARDWLVQMGTGATKSNVTVQYCMSLSRMVLQSIEIPAVTTFRASDDYHPGQTGYYPQQPNASVPPTDGSTGCTYPYCVYYVGTTSIIAHALQLKPSKDNYWSTALQKGSAFNRNGYQPTFLNDTHEPYNEMQGAISSYTGAMVAPSDGVGFSNASLINMACRSDGRLLQPSAPARAIDASFALSGGPQNKVSNVHAVMATHSLVDQAKWTQVLVIGLNASFELYPGHLGDDVGTGELLAWKGYQPSATVGKLPAANVTMLGSFDAAHPLDLARCAYSDFGLYHVAPVFPVSKLAFLGEIGKWVPVDPVSRVVGVTDLSGSLRVAIKGAADETVELAFAAPGAAAAHSVVCNLGQAAAAAATFDGTKATCTSSME
jgi:hypothetical protein